MGLKDEILVPLALEIEKETDYEKICLIFLNLKCEVQLK